MDNQNMRNDEELNQIFDELGRFTGNMATTASKDEQFAPCYWATAVLTLIKGAENMLDRLKARFKDVQKYMDASSKGLTSTENGDKLKSNADCEDEIQ